MLKVNEEVGVLVAVLVDVEDLLMLDVAVDPEDVVTDPAAEVLEDDEELGRAVLDDVLDAP